MVVHLLSATKKIKVARAERTGTRRAVGDGEIPVFSAAADFRAIGASRSLTKNRKKKKKRERKTASTNVAIN